MLFSVHSACFRYGPMVSEICNLKFFAKVR